MDPSDEIKMLRANMKTLAEKRVEHGYFRNGKWHHYFFSKLYWLVIDILFQDLHIVVLCTSCFAKSQPQASQTTRTNRKSPSISNFSREFCNLLNGQK